MVTAQMITIRLWHTFGINYVLCIMEQYAYIPYSYKTVGYSSGVVQGGTEQYRYSTVQCRYTGTGTGVTWHSAGMEQYGTVQNSTEQYGTVQ